METLKGLKYSTDHEWVRVDDGRAYIGISDYAQHALGSIVFVELPATGARLKIGDTLGVAESVKAASDIYTPVSGTVIEANEELADSPEKINEQPYESWIAVMELDNMSELDELMDAEAYAKFCAEEA